MREIGTPFFHYTSTGAEDVRVCKCSSSLTTHLQFPILTKTTLNICEPTDIKQQTSQRAEPQSLWNNPVILLRILLKFTKRRIYYMVN